MDNKEGQIAPDIDERTLRFAVRIVHMHNALARQGPAARTLAAQLLRSGTSIGANVHEAQAAESRADFVHKLAIALKEARETAYWLQLLLETDIVNLRKIAAMIDEIDHIVAIITRIILNTKRGTSAKA